MSNNAINTLNKNPFSKSIQNRLHSITPEKQSRNNTENTWGKYKNNEQTKKTKQLINNYTQPTKKKLKKKNNITRN